MGQKQNILTTLQYATAVLSFFIISCAGTDQFYRDVEAKISAGSYLEAVGEIERNADNYGEKSRVLYNLDKGLAFHYGGEYDSSNHYLLTAEKIIEDLYTKSISGQVLSVLLNDNVLPYEGEDFEKVFLNVILALNFAQKGMTEDALVEARKVDLKLREYTRKYEEKNRYKEDAFIRYIAGMLYENDDEENDAFISYKKSYEAYKAYSDVYGTAAPSFLLDDLVRTADGLSFGDEAELYLSLGGSRQEKEEKKGGSVAFIVYTGMGPVKDEVKTGVSIPDSSGTLHTFQIALPKFQPRYNGDISYDITISSESDSSYTRTEVAENITAIAGKSLDDRLTLVYLKSGGRALLKFIASEKIKNEMKKGKKGSTANILGSLAVDLVVGVTERADVRCWRLLPSEIHTARTFQHPGSYTVTVRSKNGNRILKRETVNVRAGKTAFVIVNDIGAPGFSFTP